MDKSSQYMCAEGVYTCSIIVPLVLCASCEECNLSNQSLMSVNAPLNDAAYEGGTHGWRCME